MKIPFEHRPAAHCESGVTSNMLRFYGLPMSEPMVLGLGSGLFFSHMPFIKLNGLAVTSFRPLPGQIFSRVTKGLGINVKRRWFLNKNKAMDALDALLAQGIPAGVLVGVYHLPYFPKEYRFHFNAHNICVTGKEEDDYLVSDPVVMEAVSISYADLQRVRYAKGTWPPVGHMYWVKNGVRSSIDLRPIIVKAIKLNCKRMLDIPIPYFGIKGIRLLAERMETWEKRYGSRKAALNLAQIIRMLEEIGTGGAGFRFMYAAFLQEAADILKIQELHELSVRLTRVGDVWREFAAASARKFKERGEQVSSYHQLADLLVTIADEEEQIFMSLRRCIDGRNYN